MTEYLSPGRFVDGDHPAVIEFADAHATGGSDMEKAISLFYAVRDEIRYDPYLPMGEISSYRASDAVITRRGWCVPKSALLTACCRNHGIPARPGFADVVNHLTSPKLRQQMKTDIFCWHSYCDIQLEGRWVKATPTFNKSLCDKFGLKPLEFDGRQDSLFHEFDRAGNRHMEYVVERGTFVDIPFDDIVATFEAKYGAMGRDGIDGDFEVDAATVT